LRRVRRFVLGLGLALAAASPVVPQDAGGNGAGLLTRLLQDALSGAGREVRITGFEGALSSRATIDSLTIADAEGTWLTVRDAVLDWNRAALLAGRLEVNEFSAAEIEMPRPPVRDPELPPPEATPFRIPELPVSVRIDRISAGRVMLGAPVLQQSAELTLEGRAQLAEGGLDIDLKAERLDARAGRFALEAGFAPDDGTARLDLRMEEGPEGIAATLAGLPGRPALTLTAAGDGPIRDFVTRIRLASDGQERLGGEVRLTASDTSPPDWRLALDLGGDVTALFAPELQPFFGPDVTLQADATRTAEGLTRLEDFALSARTVQAQGRFTLGEDNWPRDAHLTLRVADPEGGQVILPSDRAETSLRRAILTLSLDPEARDFTLRGSVLDLESPGFGASALRLAAEGNVTPADQTGDGAFRATLRSSAEGLSVPDPALARALGEMLQGRMEIAYESGGPLRLFGMDLAGADYGLGGAVTLSLDGQDPVADLDLALSAQDMARFSGLAGLELGGAAELGIRGPVRLLSGAFDLRIDGSGNDLGVGNPAADGLLAGRAALAMEAVRDESGMALDTLNVNTDAAILAASGRLTSAESRLDFTARLKDLGALSPDGRGAGELSLAGEAGMRGTRLSRLTLSGRAANPQGDTVMPLGAQTLRLSEGRLEVSYDAATDDAFSAETVIEAPRLSLDGESVLADRLRLRVDGMLSPDGATRADLRLRLGAQGLDAGDPSLARALGDALDLEARLTQAEGGPVELRDLELRSGAASLTGRAALLQPLEAMQIDLEAALDSGPLARFSGLAGRPLSGDVSLALGGRITPPEGSFDLTARGTARDLSLGEPTADSVLGGTTQLDLAARRSASGRLTLSRLDLGNANLTLSAEGDDSRVSYAARLRDVRPLAPDYSGPASLDGTADAVGGGWRVAARGTGPGGTEARITGLVANAGQLALSAQGTAPLGLANPFIAPRRIQGAARFDLTLQGPPRASSLAGTLSTSGARFADPQLGRALTDIDGTVRLANGTAQMQLTGQPGDGGQVSLSGPVGLTPPFRADLVARLDAAGLRDPGLYETTVDGQVQVSGPLTGGARVSGRLTLGRSEIRIPDTGITALGELPEVRHLAPPPAVRRTLSYAGLTTSGRAAASGGPPPRPYPLDLTIEAPARVFLRGRGLDAELGGSIRLTGTTANVIPQGGFELIRGRLDILGQRFDLSEGRVRLEGDFDPFLRLVARTEKDGTRISIVVEGLASSPEVRFESAPELPQDEVLARLIFGRDLSSLSPLQAVQLASAVATLAGRGGDGVLSSLREGFGLDDLDITESEDGGAAVRAGKYISENVYTDITVQSDGTSEINLNLDVSPSVTVRGGVASDGNSGLGVFFERDY